MKLAFPLALTLAFLTMVRAEDVKAPSKKDDWHKHLPEEVRAKLPRDSADLLRALGFDERPKEQTGKERSPVTMWGNNYSNFDKDDTNDWSIHVKSTDPRGRRIVGTLIYDKTEHGWTCIAKLEGLFRHGWGKYVEGRMGVCTKEQVPEESPQTQRERYYRWDGQRYIEDRVEYSRGG